MGFSCFFNCTNGTKSRKSSWLVLLFETSHCEYAIFRPTFFTQSEKVPWNKFYTFTWTSKTTYIFERSFTRWYISRYVCYILSCSNVCITCASSDIRITCASRKNAVSFFFHISFFFWFVFKLAIRPIRFIIPSFAGDC